MCTISTGQLKIAHNADAAGPKWENMAAWFQTVCMTMKLKPETGGGSRGQAHMAIHEHNSRASHHRVSSSVVYLLNLLHT